MGEGIGFGGVYGSGLVRPQRGSSIVVGHESALRFWANVRRSNAGMTKELLGELYPDDMLASIDTESVWADCSLLPLELPHDVAPRIAHASAALGLDGQLDIVVGKDSARRASVGARCHVWKGPVPDGLICCPEPGVYVVAPEVALMQVASGLGFYKTLALAMELCGTYSCDGVRGCEYGVVPVTTAARIGHLVSIVGRIRGLDAARQAARCCMDNSASPRETALAAMLSLPRRLGGWGCPRPELNVEIELSESAARQCGRSHLVADLLYRRAKLDIEYQGKEWHTADEGRSRDEARQNALMQMGYSCVFVAARQIADESKVDGITELIKRKSGLRPERTEANEQMRARRAEMLAALGICDL